ncbi:MAG: hypothetical protein PHO23_02875, partial [Candidatus Pacebacteria bacterium]|nr:hypothetical protein [Candidatus Paceibacterota bacterium]
MQQDNQNIYRMILEMNAKNLISFDRKPLEARQYIGDTYNIFGDFIIKPDQTGGRIVEKIDFLSNDKYICNYNVSKAIESFSGEKIVCKINYLDHPLLDEPIHNNQGITFEDLEVLGYILGNFESIEILDAGNTNVVINRSNNDLIEDVVALNFALKNIGENNVFLKNLKISIPQNREDIIESIALYNEELLIERQNYDSNGVFEISNMGTLIPKHETKNFVLKYNIKPNGVGYLNEAQLIKNDLTYTLGDSEIENMCKGENVIGGEINIVAVPQVTTTTVPQTTTTTTTVPQTTTTTTVPQTTTTTTVPQTTTTTTVPQTTTTTTTVP